MSEGYQPIDCGVHDRLEDLAVRRIACRIRYEVHGTPPADAAGTADAARTAGRAPAGDDEDGVTPGADEADVEGRIVDLFARDGEEYLRLDHGLEIRLDRLRMLEPVARP